MPWGVLAHGPVVLLHDAGHARSGSAVRAVVIGLTEEPKFAAARALAPGVFIGGMEDVTGFVCEHAVDVVRSPAPVLVLHDDAWKPCVGEPFFAIAVELRWVLHEESAICPVR